MAAKTFNLLSIGERGVGKTVFLAGSYTELQGEHSTEHPKASWFESQDQEVRSNIEKILLHVQNTGLYPPATIKITNFNFALKRQKVFGVKTQCKFRWWDIPGEACHIRNPDFQELVLKSHGCCVFISAPALLHDREYAQTLVDLFDQVVAIASIVHQQRLNYAFALVLTKCDLLESGTVTQLQIEQNLQPLITRLDALKANYQRFYSAIPIVSMQGTAALNARGAADPLLWLLAQLNKHHHFQPNHNLATGLAQSALSQQMFPSTLRRSVALLAIASLSILGIAIALLFTLGLFTIAPDQVPVNEQKIHL
ncbi:hypothetical protein [Leptolyngbya sp. NIES-2104]|uniref:hypothetical protein n=1 Tax=Leptolyngbya sp. NIES-2104 TaxID=1552121 RepID=UPI0006ECC702|nr:hypothetical protein [Leptolyngbya sp. NIES-2104]GAP98887.1 hypothetical protein NIES2104_54430 [Leptolyngbya sp. NIES-2104]